MAATIHQILSHAWPNRGGWRVYGDEISAGDGGAVPTLAEIAAAREATEAALLAAVDSFAIRASKRSTLRSAWDALPAFIRGPYRPEFEAANALLDSNDDEGAIALIQYAPAKPGFDESQIATFNAVKAQMVAGIESLGTP